MTLIDDLKHDEGWRPSAYKDSLGYLTIGFGFLIDERKGGELPRHIGELWLKYASDLRYDQLAEELPWLVTQPGEIQRALGNMAYQLGVNGVLNFEHMLQALENGDRERAADEALDSKWASRQTPERAHRIASLIRG